tara:strand:+ start:2704 stop:3156 length:453 start_codon:yes stop_codon:yes gene_type:complete
MELKKLMVDSKSAWIEFPGLDGFSVEVVNLSRKELQGIRKKCTTNKFDRKSRQITETLDEEKFVIEFAEKSIKNWKGLTLLHLETLLLIDLANEDPKKELPYNQENAETLVTNSNEFDTWLNEVVFDLDNFRSEPKRESNKPAGKAVPAS